MMKYINLFLLFGLILSFNVSSEELMSWQELDRQDDQYVKALYSGNYSDAAKELSDALESEDIVKQFNLANVYNRYHFHEYCHNCGICPTCVEPAPLGKAIDFNFKSTKSENIYRKLVKKGHPYAGFMWKRLNVIAFKKNTGLSTRETKMSEKRLISYVDSGDGVATFMYNYMNDVLIVRDETPADEKSRRKQVVDETISALEREAREGRVLAMFYLAITHRLQQDYVKSFAWFYIAGEKGYWLAKQYLGDTVGRFKDGNDQKAAMGYLVSLAKDFNIKLK
ncbi:MAG: hypothetical protein OQK04_04800 [Kangiellaceae bacterium]|nr:hypothetical protein [Kangiellaceae bacterium]MCW8998014.1 hypothetical protein [Kangiellaceae bacterium]